MTELELYLPIFSALEDHAALCEEDCRDAETADKASELLALLKLARERAEDHCREHPTSEEAANLRDELLPLILDARWETLLWL